MKWATRCAAVAAVTFSCSTLRANFVTNGDFSAGLAGWTVWTQRNDGGNFSVDVVNGVLQQRGDSYNGGVYQVVGVPSGVPLSVLGTWASNPTVASEQWAEIIIVEGNNPPVNGIDVTGPLIFKNDTFGGDVGGWGGDIRFTSPVANDPAGGPLGTGSPSGAVTVILKSGSITPGTPNGADFDSIQLIPEPSSLALAALGLMGVIGLGRRRRR